MADETAPSQRTILGQSRIFTPEVINDIHMKAELGRYRMRGFSLFKKMPGWDDLVFLPGTLTRFVIEGYREKCETKTVLGARFAQKPIDRRAIIARFNCGLRFRSGLVVLSAAQHYFGQSRTGAAGLRIQFQRAAE